MGRDKQRASEVVHVGDDGLRLSKDLGVTIANAIVVNRKLKRCISEETMEY